MIQDDQRLLIAADRDQQPGLFFCPSLLDCLGDGIAGQIAAQLFRIAGLGAVLKLVAARLETGVRALP